MNMKRYDVIVCGGGVSGVCAAIGAARAGASVLIIERSNCLGGSWTSGLVTWIIDLQNKKEYLPFEIADRLKECGKGRFARGGCFIYEPEAMKILLDKMCIEEKIDLRFNTFVYGAEKEGSRVISVKTASKSGQESFFGKVFIDATGDGDLCFLSGAEFEEGNEKGLTQPMSMFAIVSGLDKEKLAPFDNSREYSGEISPKTRLYEEIKRAGIECSQQKPALFYLFNDCFLLSANHIYGKKGTNADDLTEASRLSRIETENIVDALRALGGIWENIHLVFTAPSIGVREGRRIKGEYTVTLDDIYSGRQFKDSICDVFFGVDVHSLTKEQKSGYENYGDGRKHNYQIPLRAAKCLGFENLYMAGRCISGDFAAHASYRVSGDAAVIGENVGKAAARQAKIY